MFDYFQWRLYETYDKLILSQIFNIDLREVSCKYYHLRQREISRYIRGHGYKGRPLGLFVFPGNAQHLSPTP